MVSDEKVYVVMCEEEACVCRCETLSGHWEARLEVTTESPPYRE